MTKIKKISEFFRILLQGSICLAAILLVGCFAAPISNDYTARSLGKGHFDVNAGVGTVTFTSNSDDEEDGTGGTGIDPYARIDYGVTDNFDLGLVAEPLIGDYGLEAKYSFLNNTEGPSFAINGGIGFCSLFPQSGEIGGYGYLSPIFSYKIDWFEPYGLVRLNYMNGTSLGEQPNVTTDYFSLQGTVGSNFWVTKNVAINISASYLTYFSPDASGMSDSPFIFSGGLVFRF